jgi:chromosome segregation ATPase
MREKERGKFRLEELEKELEGRLREPAEMKGKLEAVTEKNLALEGNIAKMIETTKKLHERQIQLQTDLQNKASEMEAFWKKRVTFLEGEIERLKK